MSTNTTEKYISSSQRKREKVEEFNQKYLNDKHRVKALIQYKKKHERIAQLKLMRYSGASGI